MSIATDIEKIKQQEMALHFERFTEADAWALGCQMREAAIALKHPFVIDIRIAGRKLFYTALPGTTPANETWVQRKINVVMRLHKSSYLVGRELALSGRALDESQGVLPIDYATHGGSFPIAIKNTGVVGTITVSGIPQRDDHNFVIEHICRYLKLDHKSLALGPEEK
ncbi:MAG: heme-degrading domain-containing protein [Aestuariivirga sp.]